jgi:two-component system phosphate regulon sensor histidine kinase PhoR
MSEQIGQLFSQLKLQNTELQTIIGAIQEGLLVINAGGKIIVSNGLFQGAAGRYYPEALPGADFRRLIEETRAAQTKKSAKMEFLGRTYLASTNCMQEQDGIVVLFRDITEAEQLEKIKQDFVTNASHELRTPLTAIKGYVETLEDPATPEQRQYIEIINKHTDRLNNLIKDLLLLSELEEKEDLLKQEKINLGQTLQNIKGVFTKRLKEKNLTLQIERPESGPELYADSFLLERVFINLLDNAVKYTETGGIALKISETADSVEIVVSDTGSGIPQADLPRVFERFYVANKSRSRKLGGTGLGLPIVKHIILLHGGEINVDSELNKGTTFTLRLPKRFSE